MTELALVGDIGGTNSRFGLVEPGTTRVAEVAVQKNDNFASLEDSIAAYVKAKGVSRLAGAAIAVAGPVEGEVVHLTNRNWSLPASRSGRPLTHARSGSSMISRRWRWRFPISMARTSCRSAASCRRSPR